MKSETIFLEKGRDSMKKFLTATDKNWRIYRQTPDVVLSSIHVLADEIGVSSSISKILKKSGSVLIHASKWI